MIFFSLAFLDVNSFCFGCVVYSFVYLCILTSNHCYVICFITFMSTFDVDIVLLE